MPNSHEHNGFFSRFRKGPQNPQPTPPAGENRQLVPVPPREEAVEKPKEYKYEVYKIETTSPSDVALVTATYQALKEFSFSLDMEIHKKGKHTAITIKTDTHEPRDRDVQSALIAGTAEATRRKITVQGNDDAAYAREAETVAKKLLSDLVGNEGLYTGFKDYYGGLRWSGDQERFRSTLFRYAADYDQTFVEQHFTAHDIGTLAYMMDINIPWGREDKGRDKLLKDYPQLNFRRLQTDKEFRNSDEGKRLMKTYAELSGEIQARWFTDYRGIITKEGEEVTRPAIPLSHFPIIEALFVNEVALDRSLGPTKVFDLLLSSDSKPGHDAVVAMLSTRLPKEQRAPFDGPTEFGQKHMVIHDMLAYYLNAGENKTLRDLLREDILSVFDAYTGNGPIAASVLEENREQRSNPRYSWNIREVGEVKKITQELVSAGVAAPDGEITMRTEEYINSQVLMAPVNELTAYKAELIIALYDGLARVTKDSHPDVFARAATAVFGNETIGEQLRSFVERDILAKKIKSTKEALLAFEKWRNTRSLSFSDKKTAEEIASRKKYDDIVRPATELSEAVHKEKNQFLLNLLKTMGESNKLASNGLMRQLFEAVVERIKISDFEMRSLPEEYYQLMQIAELPGVPVAQKNDILWKIEQSFEYVFTESKHLLLPVVFDMYHALLGDADAVVLPTENTSHGFAAIARIVSKHGRELFKSSTQEDLERLDSYKIGLLVKQQQIESGMLLDEGQQVKPEDLIDWKRDAVKNIEHVLDQIEYIEDGYRDYVEIQAVKQRPDVYYPWVLHKLMPFWNGLRNEVRSTNPSEKIIRLHNTLATYIGQRLVIQETYPEDFDCINQGHIDGLLESLYNLVVRDHNIQYNQTVWREGNTFIMEAISHMPTSVLKQIKEKYGETPFAQYIEKEYKYWNREKEIF